MSELESKNRNQVTERAEESLEKSRSASDTASTATHQSVVAIIPAYNEAEVLPYIINETRPYVDKIIVVDDASDDQTAEVAREHADGVISHPNNMGVGGAVCTGYLAACREGHDIVIQIDADGQHDPSYIPEILDKMIHNELDMVIGSRWLNESHKDYSLVRRAGIRFFTREVNFLGETDITDVTSGFRAYRTEMLDDLASPANSHWALEQTLEAAKKGYDIGEISVPMPPENDGSQFDFQTFVKYPPRMALMTLRVLLYR